MTSSETQLVILSPSSVRFGKYIVDVKDASYKVLVKLRQAIVEQTFSQYIGMGHSFKLLQTMNELEMTQDGIERLRLNLLVFLESWWSNAPAGELPKQLEQSEIIKQLRNDMNIQPHVESRIINSVLVRFEDGSLRLEPSMTALRAKLQECLGTQSADDCEGKALAGLP